MHRPRFGTSFARWIGFPSPNGRLRSGRRVATRTTGGMETAMAPWIQRFDDIGIGDVAIVGGKNASLGEMRAALTPLGIRVPDGFATTADAYRMFLRSAGVEPVAGDGP